MSSILEELAQYSAKIANSFNELSKNIVVLNIFFWKIYDSKIDFFDELNINYQVICKKIIEINIAKSKFSKICNENKIGKYISNEKLLEYDINHCYHLDIKQIRVQMTSIYTMIYSYNISNQILQKYDKEKCLDLVLNLINLIKLSASVEDNYYSHMSMYFFEKYYEKLGCIEHVEIAILQQENYSVLYENNLDKIESIEKTIVPQTEYFFNQLSKIGITEEVIKTGSVPIGCRSSSGCY